MLRILVPAAGVAAFALVTPVTGLLLLVLGLVCLCYRQVVKTYPVAGGSYVVSRENFGFTTAQIPGAALLLSYVLTVAVSVAAGVDAVVSAFPVLAPYPVELSVGFVVLLAFGNLRGIREAGRVFAVPTYWFFLSAWPCSSSPGSSGWPSTGTCRTTRCAPPATSTSARRGAASCSARRCSSSCAASPTAGRP